MSEDKPAIGPEKIAKFIGTEEVLGHPGFLWHSKTGQTDPDLELEYQKGSYQAILSLSTAIKKRGKYDRDYQRWWRR